MYGLVNPGGLGRFLPIWLWTGPAIFTFKHHVEVRGKLLDVDPPIPPSLHGADLTLPGQAAHMLDVIA